LNPQTWVPEASMLPLDHRSRLYIQGVPGGKDLTSGECFLGQTISI
jgi:hypothetical protein